LDSTGGNLTRPTAINADADEIIAFLERRYSERLGAHEHRERAEEHAGA
jgi:hypothetical protein